MKKLIVLLVLVAAAVLLFLVTQGDEEIESLTGLDDFSDADSADLAE